MLSIGKVGGKDADPRYYTRSVAQGREDYYTGQGEAQGVWAGRGARDRGLEGPVEEDEFISTLTPPAGSERSLLAFDLTFSAPKSVSILWATAEPETSRLTRDAHDHAVYEALGYVERQAAWTRRGHGGHRHVKGEGLTIAKFRHRSSRAGDPQLHTHSVVVNEVMAEGRGTTLDGRALYAHGTTAGYLYHAALRRQLTRTVGVRWEPVENGIAEISGIDEDLRRVFSQRRQEVLEHMAKVGGRSARSAQIAVLETRRAKDYDVSAGQLHEEWQARAAKAGFGREELSAVLGVRASASPQALDAVAADLASPHGITRRASTFDRRDAVREWAAAHRDGASVAEIEALADAWMASPDAVRLDDGHERRHVGGARYSTPEMIEVERRLIATATQRKDEDVAVADRDAVNDLIAERTSLTVEQQTLVREVTRSGDGVQIIRAAAGTGKTYALAAARDAWERSSIPVYGAALAARAALELETSAGIDATTIARLTNDINHGYGLRRGSVLVVDEAGMVGSRALLELAEHAAETNSKLMLVGDDRQLPEIEAGGAFRVLAKRLGSVELHQVRRQRHEWDRDALANLRAGRTAEWARAYEAHGRITAKPTVLETRRALVDDWWQAARTGEDDVVMIAHRRTDVGDLNALARERLQHDDRLSEEQITTARGRPFAIGDRVLARRNDRRLGVINGTRGDVVALDTERGSLTVRVAPDAEVEVDRPYLDDGHLEHGYALTAHAAQGATVDRAFVLGSDELYREWGYTALSRHREEARFYIVSPGSIERALPGLEPAGDDVTAGIEHGLNASRAQHMAHELIDDRVTLAQAEAAEAADRARAADEQRERIPLWRRKERAELVRVANTQRDAAARWTDRAALAAKTVRLPPAPTVSLDPQSRDSLRQATANPTRAIHARLGERPTAFHDREIWCRAAANVMRYPGLAAEHPTLPTASPADDLELGR